MAIRTFGPNAVDWEQRIDLDRLREERLPRLKDELERSDLGALLTLRLRQHPLHDGHPHRHVGDGQADPVRAAAARRRADRLGLRLGGPPPPALQPVARRRRSGPRRRRSRRCAAPSTRTPGSPRTSPARSPTELAEHGLAGEPLGVDVVEMPVLAALRDRASTSSTASRCSSRPAGSRPRTRSPCSPRPARWSTPPTRSCTRSCAPGCGRTSASAWSARCSTTSAASTSRGSTRSPASAARRTRTSTATGSSAPATRRSSTSCTATSATGPATTAPSRSAARRRRSATRTRAAGSTWTRRSRWSSRAPPPPTSCRSGRAPRSSASPNEEAAFALQYGHGVGLSIWEKPIFSRLVSLDHPEPLEEGMVFALETYWPAADGWSAARIEEEVVVTADGCEVITKFPAEELLVAGAALLDGRRRSSTPCASRSRTSTRRQDEATGGAMADTGPSERAARPVRADGGDPAHREGRPRPVPGRPGQGHHPPGRRARGGRGRGERGAAPRRLRLRHLPRPPPRDGPRRDAPRSAWPS